MLELNNSCPDCGSADFNYVCRLIKSGRPQPYPKYVPQIKKECANCGRYIKHAEQTPDLIEAINNKYEETK